MTFDWISNLLLLPLSIFSLHKHHIFKRKVKHQQDMFSKASERGLYKETLDISYRLLYFISSFCQSASSSTVQAVRNEKRLRPFGPFALLNASGKHVSFIVQIVLFLRASQGFKAVIAGGIVGMVDCFWEFH